MATNVPFPAISRLPKPTSPKKPSTNTKHRDALNLYVQAITEGRRFPSKAIIISTIRSSSSLFLLQSIHAHVFKFGFGSDRFVAISLVSFYSENGLPRFSRRVFDGIVEKDAALYTALVVGFLANSDVDAARRLFDEMPDRDVVAWNAIISGHVNLQLPGRAIELFRRMRASGVGINQVTLTATLSACSRMGLLRMGESVHAYIAKELDAVEVMPKLYNSLVHMYARCGRLEAALRLFVEKEDRNLELWNTMLTGFAVHGFAMATMSLLAQMLKAGRMPDRITFIGLLTACSHAGIVENAERFFASMSSSYGLEPGPEHYGCMVDVLSRAGFLKEASLLLKSMPFEGDVYGWGAFLSGCHTHSNYEFGVEAAKHLLELQPWNESRYIALVNLYLLVGRYNDAIEIRRKMLGLGIEKSSACSMVEIDGVMHEFIAGDGTHHRSRDIYSMLDFVVRNSVGE